MPLLDVRRLVAVDLHGVAGTRLRRRLILAEFTIGAPVCLALGLWIAVAASSGTGRLVGAWTAGVGLNYAALAIQAVLLVRPGALDAELAGADIGSELRRYSYLQAWVFVPVLVAALAVRQRRSRPA